MSMSNKPSNQSKLKRFIRAPFKFLGKAKNFYVQCMYSCAAWTSYGDDIGFTPIYFPSQPIRTFPSRDADDLQDLVKANSVHKIEIDSKSDVVKKVEMEILQLRQQNQAQTMAKKMQRRKNCEVIQTIDEDKICEFGVDLKLRTDFLQYPRSRSCSVTKRTGVVG
ncbi:hypothetical protein NE237_017756 [Protea cynaroides]|uniref:Uncharacterized protein n=1 Tax=Protea cynaroides TaxID=273540 RepID=A0A9Q0QNC0_9MAGN|nr:hypothetical protein NE237_017756 [Protea cynaroides]